MRGHIGLWDIKGIADLIAVWPSRDGKVKVRIFEIKSSWKEQTAHRIQVAIYVLVLNEALGDLAAKIDFEGGVINKESDLEKLEPERLPSFRLEPLIQDIQRLLSENGELYRIHQKPLCRSGSTSFHGGVITAAITSAALSARLKTKVLRC